MLADLPPEVVAQIADNLICESGSPPVALLCTCQSIHNAISPGSNPNLYAQAFRTQYDVGAAARRLARAQRRSGPIPSRSNGLMTKNGGVGHTLGPNEFAGELRNRTLALTRLGRALENLRARRTTGPTSSGASATTAKGKKGKNVSLENGSDSAEITVIDGETIHTIDLWVVYIMLLENDKKNIRRLVPPLVGGPSVDMVELIKLLLSPTTSVPFLADPLAEGAGFSYPPERALDSLTMWIAWFLDEYTDRTTATLRTLRPYVFASHQYELYYAPWTVLDLPVKDRVFPVLPGPLAIDRNPKSRACKVPFYGTTITLATPPMTHAAMLRFLSGPQDANDPSTSTASSLSDFQNDIEVTDLRAPPSGNLKSKVHDDDFERLRVCSDGRWSNGRRVSDWRGIFSGCWEGTFTFFEFSVFRSIIAGDPRAIYNGSYGEQAQVWKLRETFVRPKREVGGGTNTATAGNSTQSLGLPLTGPMENAGFPNDLRPFTANLYTTRLPGLTQGEAMTDDVLGRLLDAFPDHEVVPDDELDAECARADAGEDTGLTLLVTGVGHSAWGRFVISGHIRPWDGLIYLVKEYAPYQRGKWVYRGYVVSSDLMVGRWRDTFTSAEYDSYEGTFLLSRR